MQILRGRSHQQNPQSSFTQPVGKIRSKVGSPNRIEDLLMQHLLSCVDLITNHRRQHRHQVARNGCQTAQYLNKEEARKPGHISRNLPAKQSASQTAPYAVAERNPIQTSPWKRRPTSALVTGSEMVVRATGEAGACTLSTGNCTLSLLPAKNQTSGRADGHRFY